MDYLRKLTMDRLIDQKRIELWKNLEDESKKNDALVLIGLENIILEEITPCSLIRNGSKDYSTIAKSIIYLDSNGTPEQIIVYKREDISYHRANYGSHRSCRRERRIFDGIWYQRKSSVRSSRFYELISKPDNPEKVKSLYEVIKLLDENGILKQYLSNYSELITENCHDYIDILLKENELRSKQVVDKFYELIAKLK